jgi:S-adenosylmethionine-dependent methyltransferase
VNPSDDPFSGKAAFFDRHYREGTRGRMRLELVLERLRRALPPPPATVLDAGGGTGAFAIPLARDGYDVTVLDRSDEWLEVAARNGRDAGVDLRLVHGSAESAPEAASGPFDAVLCHTVLIYAEDPGRVLGALREVARDGAVLSSLEKNRDALPVRPAREGDFGEALRVMDDPIATGRIAIPNRALSIGELRSAMVATRWLPTSWAGIRTYSDGVLEPLDARTFDTAMTLERKAAVRDPHRRLGRLLHVRARAWQPQTLDAIQARSLEGAGPGTRESWPASSALVSTALDEFLERKRYAALSTTHPSGRPHSTMVAYCVRDGRIWLPTVSGAQRLRNVAAEPSASMLVTEGERDEHVAVLIEGHTTVHDDPGSLLGAWLGREWRTRHGTELDWAGAVIELIPNKILSFAARANSTQRLDGQ